MRVGLVIKFLILLGFLVNSPSSLAASCASDSISFAAATAVEEAAACASLEQVSAYFTKIGAAVPDLKIKFIFAPQITLPGSFPGDEVPVHGYFDTDDNSIHMTHFDSASQKERRPWGLSWTQEMASSLLLHEITHLYAIAYMKESFRELPHHWHEFIAYAVELELMPETLRNQVLANYDAKAFDAPADVSAMHYEFDPEKYAVRAYKSLQAWGGDQFLKDLIDRKIPEAKDR